MKCVTFFSAAIKLKFEKSQHPPIPSITLNHCKWEDFDDIKLIATLKKVTYFDS